MAGYILSAYAGDIYFDLMVHEEPADAVIVLEGFPAKGQAKDKINFLYEQGFNVFWPHYKGTYQSRGLFLEENIVDEMNEFITFIEKGTVTSLWDLTDVTYKNKRTILMGSSFSGAICCGLAAKRNFDSMILFAPVWDYAKHNEKGDEQDLDMLMPFIKRGYENLIRFNWDSLYKQFAKFPECSPDNYVSKIKTPLLVLHDPKDKTVSIEHSKKMAPLLQAGLIEHSEGHGMAKPMEIYWKEIADFIEKH